MVPATVMAASAAVYRRWRIVRLPHREALEQARNFSRQLLTQDNLSEAEFEADLAAIGAALTATS